MIELSLLERHGFKVRAHCRYPYWVIEAQGQTWLIGREDGELVSATPWLKETLAAIREHYQEILTHPAYKAATDEIRKQCWNIAEWDVDAAINYLNLVGSDTYKSRSPASYSPYRYKALPPKLDATKEQILATLERNPAGLSITQTWEAVFEVGWEIDRQTVWKHLQALEENQLVTRAYIPQGTKRQLIFLLAKPEQSEAA